MVRISLAALLLLNGFTSRAQVATDSDAQIRKTMQQWVTLQAMWGAPESQPVKGSSLQVEEKSREAAADGHTIIHYNFTAAGLPSSGLYRMEYWPVGGQTSRYQLIARGLRVNAKGQIVCGPKDACGDKTKPEFPLEVALPGAKGDTHRFVFTSERDSKVWVTGMASPFPITSFSNGCRLDLIRVTPRGELLLLLGSGFSKNSEVRIEGDSAGEMHTSVLRTDSQGAFKLAQAPFVKGKESGSLSIQVMDGATCRPSVVAEWGEGSNKPQ